MTEHGVCKMMYANPNITLMKTYNKISPQSQSIVVSFVHRRDKTSDFDSLIGSSWESRIGNET